MSKDTRDPFANLVLDDEEQQLETSLENAKIEESMSNRKIRVGF
jgi:hypothetical protein